MRLNHLISDEEVNIEWEQGDLIEHLGHTSIYAAEGESDTGRKFVGTWETCNGEFADITDIEEL